jgi:hypothetical protein
MHHCICTFYVCYNYMLISWVSLLNQLLASFQISNLDPASTFNMTTDSWLLVTISFVTCNLVTLA